MANPLIIDCTGLASGTGAIGLNAVIDTDVVGSIFDETVGLVAGAGATINAQGCEFAASSGTINPPQGDRAVWDAAAYAARHTNDADTATTSIHHTLGTGADQAAAGNHSHSITPGSMPLTNTHILVGNGSNVAADVAMSNDATIANTGAFTLATVNSNVGTFGDATNIPQITVNGKGLVTAVSNIAVTFPASVVSTYNETQLGDGSTTIFYLANYALPGTVRVYIDGILQPVTDDLVPSDIVIFATAPAIGALLTWNYDVEIV